MRHAARRGISRGPCRRATLLVNRWCAAQRWCGRLCRLRTSRWRHARGWGLRRWCDGAGRQRLHRLALSGGKAPGSGRPAGARARQRGALGRGAQITRGRYATWLAGIILAARRPSASPGRGLARRRGGSGYGSGGVVRRASQPGGYLGGRTVEPLRVDARACGRALEGRRIGVRARQLNAIDRRGPDVRCLGGCFVLLFLRHVPPPPPGDIHPDIIAACQSAQPESERCSNLEYAMPVPNRQRWGASYSRMFSWHCTFLGT
jgi:hypothetical protein